jgi:hypothetical protein
VGKLWCGKIEASESPERPPPVAALRRSITRRTGASADACDRHFETDPCRSTAVSDREGADKMAKRAPSIADSPAWKALQEHVADIEQT